MPLKSNILIRQLIHKDLPALEWDGEFTHFRRLYEQAFRRAENGESVLWVAELPKVGIIGQLFVQLINPRLELADGVVRAFIYSFRVRSPYRGIGVGTHLMQTAEADLEKRGFHRTTLNVGRNNDEARRLYEHLGYHIVAAEPGNWSYLDHRGRRRHVNEPAWRLEKDIRSDRLCEV